MNYSYNCCLCDKHIDSGWITWAYYKYIANNETKHCNTCHEIIKKAKKLNII